MAKIEERGKRFRNSTNILTEPTLRDRQQNPSSERGGDET